MSEEKAERKVREARSVLGRAVNRRQPASVNTLLGVMELLHEATEQTEDPVFSSDIFRAAIPLLVAAGGKTKRKRLHGQWATWRNLDMMIRSWR